MRKYQLYATKSGWESKNAALESHFDLPIGTSVRYAEIGQVVNPDNADFGKYIMPAVGEGTWACQDQFDSSKLVEGDPTWYGPPPNPE